MTPNKQTLDRYLESSNLSQEDQKRLKQKFETAKDKKAVMTEAMRLNQGKGMSKVPKFKTK